MSTEGERDLLLTSADAEDWFRRAADDVEDSGQFFRRISVPGMALSAEDDVRRRKHFHELGRNVREPLRHYPQIRLDPFECRANLARAVADAFDGVVN